MERRIMRSWVGRKVEEKEKKKREGRRGGEV
jgi:hypothetical protein